VSRKPVRSSVEPLRTRHVFLDTEVYRRAGFNLHNTQFALLGDHVSAGRIVLHVTDVTLAEINRQLTESVHETASDAKRLSRDFNRLRQISGDDTPAIADIDGPSLAETAWKGFLDILLGKFGAHSILALQVPARKVFEAYFSGQPPFETRGSKEFPDAFVIEGLADYCASNGVTMYVVSGDNALRRAAGNKERLIALAGIEDVLAAATAEKTEELEPLVDDVFAAPGFDGQLTNAIAADLDFVNFVYYGTLTDGSVNRATLEEIVNVDDYRVAAFDGMTLGLILHVNTILNATVDYIDEEELRDKDADIIPTQLERSSITRANLKIYVSIDLTTLRFTETELLTKDIIVE